MRNLPKSLHTVTVIVRLARMMRGTFVMGDDLDNHAVDRAIKELGLSGLPDPHGLRAAAVKQLEG